MYVNDPNIQKSITQVKCNTNIVHCGLPHLVGYSLSHLMISGLQFSLPPIKKSGKCCNLVKIISHYVGLRKIEKMAEGNSINTGRETLPQRGKVDKGKTSQNLHK